VSPGARPIATQRRIGERLLVELDADVLVEQIGEQLA